MGTRRSFRVVLHTEYGHICAANARHGAIIQVHVGQLNLGMCFHVFHRHGKPVVL